MQISVVIPTYNRASTLQRALDSVFSQSALPAEVIVVDDGSTDRTEDLVKSEYPFARYFYQSNQGVSAARNAGIRRANFPWLAFLDSDDRWLTDKLASQIRLLEERAELKVCHTEEIWIRNGVRVNPMKKHAKPDGWIYPNCLPLCCVSPSSILLHQSVLQVTGVFDEELPACEDYDLWLRIFSRFPVGLVSLPMLEKYGGHRDQLSRKHPAMDRFRVHALQKALCAGYVTGEDYVATVKTLTQKCAILAEGARKRKNKREEKKYREISTRWEREL